MLIMSVHHSLQYTESFFMTNGPEHTKIEKFEHDWNYQWSYVGGRKQASQIYHSLEIPALCCIIA